MDIRQAAVAEKQQSIRHPWELSRLEILKALFSTHCAEESVGNDAVLDVGCGDGFIAKTLAGIYVSKAFFGVDPARSDAEDLDGGHEEVVLRESLDDIHCADGAIRTILILDVLEHIEDDKGALRDLLADEKVHKDVQFIIFVPAFQSLYYSHDKTMSHYRRYSRTLLLDTVKECGLKPLESGYFFTVLLPFRILEVVLEKLSLAKQKDFEYSSTWKRGEVSAKFVAALLEMEFRVTRTLRKIGITVPGLSTFVVCKRS